MNSVFVVFSRELKAGTRQPWLIFALVAWILLFALLSLGLDTWMFAGAAEMRRPMRWMALLLCIWTPALTMRSFSEERRSGAAEWLWTLPVSPVEWVVGKWLLVWLTVLVALLTTLPWPLFLEAHGDPEWAAILGGYLGMALVGGALSAMGVLISAIVDHPLSAWMWSLLLGLMPWILGWLLPSLPAGWVQIVQYLSFDYHFVNLARGVLDSTSLIFFCSLTVLALGMAALSLEIRRLS